MPAPFSSTDHVEQDYLTRSGFPYRIPLYRYDLRTVKDAVNHLRRLDSQVLGIAVQLRSEGTLESIAFASASVIVHLNLRNTASGPPSAAAKEINARTLENVFSDPLLAFAGFGMAYLALHIHRDMVCHVRGVDLTTLYQGRHSKDMRPSEAIQAKVHDHVDRFRVDSLWDDHTDESVREVSLRAWLSACLAEVCCNDIMRAKRVDTANLSTEESTCFCGIISELHLLRTARPVRAENDFTEIKEEDNSLALYNSRFKTRVRQSNKTRVEMVMADGTSTFGVAGRAVGKRTELSCHRAPRSLSDVTAVRVHGREELTCAEKSFDEFVLRRTQGPIENPIYVASYFIRLLWFPYLLTDDERPSPPKREETISIDDLNSSQSRVVDAMMSGDLRVVIAHGPPGTGKTTTIGAAVKQWSRVRKTVWVVAQSNVAVKNIAESLAKRGVDFKLLVSKEFYEEWHEHIYEKVEDCIIRSDEMPQEKIDVGRLFLDCRVVLSTLSMLSNPMLVERGVFDLIPVERLVIDEASQINIVEYMHLFHRFRDLEKVCFFGDPKQLPPYGQETASSLRSIFDVRHLRLMAYFLDVQYRMPVPLGDFISAKVYDRKLKSEHEINDSSCIRFIDVWKGCEEKSGHSWKNVEEVHTIVRLVKSYYRHKDFVIITPYDAQRAAIVSQLEKEGLASDSVFNVDSYQGNEEAYVILSIVRTAMPGFLKSRNRTNVMLTRCKKGLIIVTNKKFMRQPSAANTLVGQLADHWENWAGAGATWEDWRSVADGRAFIPGCPTSSSRSNSVFSMASSRTYTPPDMTRVTASVDNMQISPSSSRASGSASLDHAQTQEEKFPALPTSDAKNWRRKECHSPGLRDTVAGHTGQSTSHSHRPVRVLRIVSPTTTKSTTKTECGEPSPLVSKQRRLKPSNKEKRL